MAEFREIELDSGDERKIEEEEEEEDEDEKEEEEEFDDSIRKTSTHQGARPKVRTSNYNQMLSEQNRKDVKFFFPKMNDDVDVQHTPSGKIQIGIYGSEEWINFKKSNGKINTFSVELKKSLGPSLKKLESDYFTTLKRIFPHMNEKDFELIYGKDQFRIRLRGEKNKGWILFKKDGELKVKIDKRLKKFLGQLSEDIIDENKREIELNQSKIDEIDDELKNTELDGDQKENLNNERSILTEGIDELEKMNEDLEVQMILKEPIKAIFKKHGLTIITVTSALVTVISAIVSNLRIGLSKLTKDLGNGLKEIGKKLADILPGMVGAIASFIFRTAGEVTGFLSKNAWLLIIAVVVAVVDRFKKKNK